MYKSKMKLCVIAGLLLLGNLCLAGNRWTGKKVAVLGDSISDSIHVGTDKCWWEMLSDSLGLQTFCYAKNGWTVEGMQTQAQWLLEEEKNSGRKFDLILIFGGTNDFNSQVPLGEFYSLERAVVSRDGQPTESLHRVLNFDNGTFCGRLNNLLSTLKNNCPDARILILTPIHRGFAQFGATNEQPEETWSNRAGLFLDDYLDKIEQASRLWAVPVLDLNVQCELYPVSPAYDNYFHDRDTDRLHPNTAGHRRMALAIQGYLEHLFPW